jgi:hypothetical protein
MLHMLGRGETAPWVVIACERVLIFWARLVARPGDRVVLNPLLSYDPRRPLEAPVIIGVRPTENGKVFVWLRPDWL